jgi:hypothetical protein
VLLAICQVPSQVNQPEKGKSAFEGRSPVFAARPRWRYPPGTSFLCLSVDDMPLLPPVSMPFGLFYVRQTTEFIYSLKTPVYGCRMHCRLQGIRRTPYGAGAIRWRDLMPTTARTEPTRKRHEDSPMRSFGRYQNGYVMGA